MAFWFRSSRSDGGSENLPREAGREPGYYALDDPFGSALDDFDTRFGSERKAKSRSLNDWKFWQRWRQSPPEEDSSEVEQPAESRWHRRWRWFKFGVKASLLVFLALVAWLAVTAPLSKSLEPIVAPQITLLASNGTPIARSGAVVAAPVKVARLPDHVVEAFLATEDRRFYRHWGVDPRGLARAAFSNLTGGPVQGGSTITQQLAKFTFLTPDQTLSRKAREMLIAFWLEAWLTKDEILERYLSNAYFGDNQYGLRAASLHYFYRQPENLKPEQAAMLAGLLKAPSRLAPTRNLKRARARMRVVLAAMVDAGYLSREEARKMPVPRLDVRAKSPVPTGTYFADWALPIARQKLDRGYKELRLTTTLDARLQRLARRVVARARLGKAQVALVAMRPNGEVVAMLGGKDYAASPFNRVTQAHRQPGSTFKLFVYLAAIEAGMGVDSKIDNSPIEKGSYRPRNAGEHYSAPITLKQAFAKSSNVAAVRLFYRLKDEAIINQARRLGIASRLPRGDPSLALGTSNLTLLELTAAYAGIAGNNFPVEPHAFKQEKEGFFDNLFDGKHSLSTRSHSQIEQMLRAAINVGTGRAATLSIPNYGKTGTSQDNRDALFVGYARNLVVGVWIGNDDNSPLSGVSGGGLPARIWRNFMQGALKLSNRKAQPHPADRSNPGNVSGGETIQIDRKGSRLRFGDDAVSLETAIDGNPVQFRFDQDGLSVRPAQSGKQ